jgi:iron complex outermembrane recepter protein
MKGMLLSGAAVAALVISTSAAAQVAPAADPAPAPGSQETSTVSTSPGSPSATNASVGRGGSEEIIVTARRVAENLQNVPLAVSAISGAALQRQAIREVRDLASIVPNVQIRTGNQGGNAVLFTIRGQSQSNNGLLYIDPAVGVYIDGLSVPRNFGVRTGLVDVQRVEALRGPQGTLYGRNTTGGAVSIVTQDPKDEWGASAQGSYGNYNAWQLTGILNVPLGEGVGLRLVGQHSDHGPYGHQVATRTKLLTEESTYLRAKLKIDTGAVKLAVTGDYFKFKSGPPIWHLVGLTPADAGQTKFSGRVCVPAAAGVPGVCTPAGGAANTGIFYGVAGGTATNIARIHLGLPLTPAGLDAASAYLAQFVRRGSNPSGADFYDSLGTTSAQFFGEPNYPRNRSNSEGGSIVANLDVELSDQLTARSISGWRHYSRLDAYDFDSTPLPLFETRNGTPFADFYSEEAQLLGNFDRLNFVLGGYYSYENGIDYTPSMALQTPGASNFGAADGRSRNISAAVFAQGNYKITDALTLTLGARYTKEIHKLRNRNHSVSSTGLVLCSIPQSLLNDPQGPVYRLADPVTGAATAVSGPCGFNGRVAFKKPTWLASLDYKITPDVLAYVKASRGFRGGGEQGRAATPTIPLSFVPFAPEIVTEYETGLKSQLFDRRLRLNLAVFYDKYNDVQRSLTLPAPGGGGYTVVTNAAKARLWGVEGEGNLRLTDELSFDGTFGYLNAKYNTFSDFLLGDRSGEPWPAPKWTYTIGARYERPIGSANLSSNLQWVWTGTQNLQPQALNRDQNIQKGYGLINGTIALQFPDQGFEISAFGRNLTAKHYYVTGISLESVGLNVLMAGEPRTFGLQLTKKFGSEK